MSENKRRRKGSSKNQPLKDKKRRREESLENEPLSENKRPREESVERNEEIVENEPLNKNQPPGEESVQNEPLDLSLGARKSPDIQTALKKTRTSVWDAAAKNAAEKAAAEKAAAEKAEKKKKKKRRRSRRKNKKAAVKEESGVKYPIDLWFLIADYINPENVGKFARICKDTLAVIDSAAFWIRLFRRYGRPTKHFSGKLKPGALQERHCLKFSVIRALYATYKPFIERTAMNLKQPDIRHRQVVREWVEGVPGKPYACYYFELKDFTYKTRLVKEDGQEFVKDILVNPLEGCVLLQVVCPYMLGLPQLRGLILVDVVFVRLQNRMFQMNCTFHTLQGEDKVQIVKMLIGPALSISVIDWWNPRYPVRVPEVFRHWKLAQSLISVKVERRKIKIGPPCFSGVATYDV